MFTIQLNIFVNRELENGDDSCELIRHKYIPLIILSK